MPKAAENAYSVDVSLRDDQINMDEQLYAGPTNFIVHNEGQQEHNFRVEGVGTREKFDSSLKPGEQRILQVHLEPGRYTVSCPEAHHEGKRMEKELNVVGPKRAADDAEVQRETT